MGMWQVDGTNLRSIKRAFFLVLAGSLISSPTRIQFLSFFLHLSLLLSRGTTSNKRRNHFLFPICFFLLQPKKMKYPSSIFLLFLVCSLSFWAAAQQAKRKEKPFLFFICSSPFEAERMQARKEHSSFIFLPFLAEECSCLPLLCAEGLLLP